MPTVKKIFQDSEDPSEAAYIFGHMFGGLGILIGNQAKKFCLPLSIRPHDRLQFLETWKGASGSIETHAVQMVEDAYDAKTFGSSLLLLNRYFLSISTTCFLQTEPNLPKQSWSCMESKHKQNICVLICFGGRNCTRCSASYLKYGNTQRILVSTCLELTPEAIIRLYSCRFRIKGCFRELKQQIGGFGYHFWTRAMPKLNHCRKKESSQIAITNCVYFMLVRHYSDLG